MDEVKQWPAVPVVKAGLLARCPRCGEGRLFDGFLELARHCDRCGLDYAFANAGDGPAVFVIMIAGFLVVGSALATEILLQPPIWVHLALWTPLTFGLAIGLLRPFKAVLVALQYKYKAAPGALDGGAQEGAEPR